MKCPNCGKIAGQLSMIQDEGKCPLCARKGVFRKEDIERAKSHNRKDNDGDGVPDGFDCEPNNPDKQDKWKNKFNLKGKSKVNSVLKKIMG